MALWICAMVVTLLGALGGGYVAGYLSPGARSLHGRRPSALTPETQSAALPPPGCFPVAPAHTAGQID